jgi:putative flippase GtrA
MKLFAGIQGTLKFFDRFHAFSVVGILTTTVHYFFLWAGTEIFLVPPVLASSVGYVAGGLVSYLVNYRYTFFSKEHHRKAAPKFMLVVSFGFLLNGALISLFFYNLEIELWVSQAMTTLVCLVWNYVSSKLWVFRVNK